MPADDVTVTEAGERELLAAVFRHIGPSHALVGPGDDAAVLQAAGGRIVATVDTLVQGPDFRLEWTGGHELGWKSAAVNLADVAAMGCRPTALLVALTLPADTRVGFVTDLADGLRDACAQLAPGCAIEGGDLAVSPTLTVAVTALGVPDGIDPVTRAGARPGDVLALAGDAGRAARGLRVLFEHFTDRAGRAIPLDRTRLTDADTRDVDAQLRPRPPVRLGPVAARAGATAMMDVSDGLALDATRLAEASGVTCDIDPATLGPDPATALGGGEDHALLAAFPLGRALPTGFRVIGSVGPRGTHALTVAGRPYTRRGGWDPYRDGVAASV